MTPAPAPQAVPPPLAALLSALAARDIRISFAFGGESFSLLPRLAHSLHIPPAAAGIAPEPGGVGLCLDLGGQTALLCFGPLLARRFLSPDGLDPAQLPPELLSALYDLQLTRLLDRISAMTGAQTSLLRVVGADGSGAPPTDGDRFVLPFRIVDESGGNVGNGTAQLPLNEPIAALLREFSRAFSLRPLPANLSLPVSLCLARRRFPLAVLQEARAGDILLFRQGPFSAEITLEVRGRALWRGILDTGEVRLLEACSLLRATPEAAPATTDIPIEEEAMENDMGPQEPGSATDAAVAENAAQRQPPALADDAPAQPATDGSNALSPSALNELEVSLSLEIEEVVMTVGELAALAPGSVIRTLAAPDRPVTIKARNKVLGCGRLVDVGGQLGVMIVDFAYSGTAGQTEPE